MIAVFFGGSIFVHELGHFLAARRRGLKVERFSIGFGPRIAGWKGKDGVDYRLSLLPFGGYVALPQLADMSAIEGNPSEDATPLPPITYATKLIVFVAGAVFNLIFAFLLACLLWFVGQPVSKEDQTTRIGYVQPALSLPNGEKVEGPAFAAGLQQGDIIRLVDGHRVNTFTDIDTLVAIGAGRTDTGKPEVELTVQRDDQTLLIPIVPAYSGPEKIRQIGIEPAVQPMVTQVMPDSAAGAAGLKPLDVIVALDDQSVEYVSFVSDYLRIHGTRPVKFTYERAGQLHDIMIQPRLMQPAGVEQPTPLIGVSLIGRYSTSLVHTAPWTQMWSHAVTTWRTLSSLLNPKSDIGPSKLSGPVGIARVFHITAQIDIRLVIWFTVLVNVNLAMLNLLPIPVLDGGHMAFATIEKLRGRPLPMQAIATVQSVFMVLLFSMIIYVTFFDVRRLADNGSKSSAEPPAQTAPATPEPGTASAKPAADNAP